jgi:glycerol-1-phosphate dehydrogenase [NAD(P)+]
VPRITYEGIEEATKDIDDYVVLTQEPPWEKVSGLFPRKPKKAIIVENLEQKTLEGYIQTLPKSEYIVGLGGGTAVDAAKYIAMQTRTKLVTIPSVVSVNAFLSWKAALRIDGIVNYVGDIYPEFVVIDYPTIKNAPARLNRAGIGDLYATRTSLADWRIELELDGGSWKDEEIMRESQDVLDRLVRNAKEIHDVTERGIKLIVDSDDTMLSMAKLAGERGRPDSKTWPTDGSEHMFFYSLEKVTGKSFIHGEIVGMGSVVATYMEGGDVQPVIEELDLFGLRFRPADNDISYEVFEKAVRYMKEISHTIDVLRDSPLTSRSSSFGLG